MASRAPSPRRRSAFTLRRPFPRRHDPDPPHPWGSSRSGSRAAYGSSRRCRCARPGRRRPRARRSMTGGAGSPCRRCEAHSPRRGAPDRAGVQLPRRRSHVRGGLRSCATARCSPPPLGVATLARAEGSTRWPRLQPPAVHRHRSARPVRSSSSRSPERCPGGASDYHSACCDPDDDFGSSPTSLPGRAPRAVQVDYLRRYPVAYEAIRNSDRGRSPSTPASALSSSSVRDGRIFSDVTAQSMRSASKLGPST